MLLEKYRNGKGLLLTVRTKPYFTIDTDTLAPHILQTNVLPEKLPKPSSQDTTTHLTPRRYPRPPPHRPRTAAYKYNPHFPRHLVPTSSMANGYAPSHPPPPSPSLPLKQSTLILTTPPSPQRQPDHRPRLRPRPLPPRLLLRSQRREPDVCPSLPKTTTHTTTPHGAISISLTPHHNTPGHQIANSVCGGLQSVAQQPDHDVCELLSHVGYVSPCPFHRFWFWQ